MKVHQAVFGSGSRGHMLLACSSEQDLPLQELEQRTDLPVTVHEAIDWQPYDSGYPLGDRWYVLTRTVPDLGASRAGSVITHALLFDAEDASRSASLHGLRALLPSPPMRLDTIEPLIVADIPLEPEEILSVDDPRIRAVLEGVLEAAPEGRTVAWRGQEGFGTASDQVWGHLWPAARRDFSFRLAFRPDDMEADVPTLVAVPEAAARLWWHGHPMIEGERQAADPPRPALAYLMGVETGAALADALEAFGGELTDLESLLRLESAARRYHELPSLDAGRARGLAHLVGLLSPEPARGRAAKTRVLDHLIERTIAGPVRAILGLRNLDLTPFPGGVERVRSAVERWVLRELSPTAVGPASEVVEVLRSATEQGVAEAGPWALTGVPGVERALLQIESEAAGRVWEVWVEAPLLVPIVTKSPAVTAMHLEIASACPTRINAELSTAVRMVAKDRGWTNLHAVAAAASLSAAQSVDAHLDAFPTGNGLSVLAGRLAPADRVWEALRTGAAPLIGAAVDALVSDPALLALGNAEAAPWQDLVSRAAILKTSIWTHLPDADRLARGLLDRIREGTASSEAQHALAESPFASLLAEANRDTLWPQLDPRWREVFLKRTAEAYLEDLWQGNPVPTTLESPLRTVVWAAVREQLVGGSMPDAEAMAVLARTLPELDEHTFIQWVYARIQRPLLAASADVIGRTIQERRWAEAAHVIAQTIRNGRRDLAPTFERSSPLLDMWTQLMTTIFLSPHHEGEHLWWHALEEVAIDLYRTGPMDRDVWSRAGGNTDSLDLRGTGRDQWHRAIDMLRKRGGGKRIGPRELLRVMQYDYPNNDQVRDLVARGF